MKYKSLILGFVLCFCGIFSVLGLSGCGDVSLSTVAESFEKLEQKYADNTAIFNVGNCEGMETKYLISYGEKVDGYVSQNLDGYGELLKLYNVTLVISSDYIDNNKMYILNLTEDKLNPQSKKSFNALNDSIIAYTESINEFVKARSSFVNYFAQFDGQMGEEANAAYLRKFKKSYGDLVSKNIALSMNLAKSVETTEIFELLKNTPPTENDTKIMKEYIRAKLLPVYSEFLINEIENNLNWKGQAQTATKTRIDNLMTKLNESFEVYKARFVTSNANLKVLTHESINNLFDMVENFLVETDAYYYALKNLNISSLAIEYDNDLAKYKKVNSLAETYLEKLEQYIDVSLPNFINQVLTIIY